MGATAYSAEAMVRSEVDRRSAEIGEADRFTEELAAALARLRRVRAALAAHGAPLAPVVEETDRLIAMGERLAAKLVGPAGRPRDQQPPAA